MSLPSNYLTASETIPLVRSGKLTITQLVLDHLQRYDERNETIQAWAYLERERALAEAKKLDELREADRGPLYGCVLGVKDIFNTKDMPTRHGSKVYKDSCPGVDAAPVMICRAAGALILGKTAGSMIRPGSYNGIFAYKPTWGAVSRDGVKISSLTLDTVGFYSRSVADLQLLAKVFHIEDDGPPPPVPKPLSQTKFAYVRTDQWSRAPGPSPDLQRAWANSKDLLLSAGATLTDLELPPEFNRITGVRHQHIMEREGCTSFLPEYIISPGDLSQDVLDRAEDQNKVTRKMQLEALDTLAALRPVLDKLLREFDAVITPSVPGEAPLGLSNTGDPKFCSMWTAMHVPCVNVPGFAGGNGMPIGLTLVAPRFEDQRLLSVAEEVAKVWVEADVEKYIHTPAPPGAKHAQA